MSECNCCSSSVVACNLTVFGPEEKLHYDELRKELTKNLTVEKTNAGYTFLYPNETELLQKIVAWIAYENRCCPFINFSLYVNGESKFIRLDLTGNETIRKLLQVEFNLY